MTLLPCRSSPRFFFGFSLSEDLPSPLKELVGAPVSARSSLAPPPPPPVIEFSRTPLETVFPPNFRLAFSFHVFSPRPFASSRHSRPLVFFPLLFTGIPHRFSGRFLSTAIPCLRHDLFKMGCARVPLRRRSSRRFFLTAGWFA